MRKICLLNFIITNIVLKKGASFGLTPFEIGSIMYKDYNQKKAYIQSIIRRIHAIIPLVAKFNTKKLN